MPFSKVHKIVIVSPHSQRRRIWNHRMRIGEKKETLEIISVAALVFPLRFSRKFLQYSLFHFESGSLNRVLAILELSV